ncbi:MAG: preprotein translocase subunit SecE [Cyanobacteria bacterium P01_D01_bin.156]
MDTSTRLDVANKEANDVVKKDAKKVVEKQPSESSDSFDAGSFVKGTREELSKVVWPSRQQLLSESAAVIFMVGMSATLIYLVDKLFGWASRQVF